MQAVLSFSGPGKSRRQIDIVGYCKTREKHFSVLLLTTPKVAALSDRLEWPLKKERRASRISALSPVVQLYSVISLRVRQEL